MQHVNDDMDELFRRAAESYPLNTDSADWNAVAKKLSADNATTDKGSAKSTKKYKHLLWLLLLLPVGWLSYNYVFDNKTPDTPVSKNIRDNILQDASLSKKINPASGAAALLYISRGNSTGLNSQGLRLIPKSRLNVNVKQNNSISILPGNSSTEQANHVLEAFGNKENAVVTEKSDLVSGNNTREIVRNTAEPLKEKLIENEKDGMIPEILNDNKEIPKNSKKKTGDKERGLYAGIVISPDISTVKFQSVKNMGVGMGILIGYQFSKKVSVETGISWDIKNYYSDGRYFSTKRVYTNPNAKIINVDGVCNMIEIPITIRYNLTTGKTYFSTSAGVSSYIMKKEKYDYIIIYNNGQPYPRTSTYYDSSTNLLAIANLSVGYNRTLKHNLTLRIEPYLKIPLKGVGIGSLPIMSTGLNLGLTKKLSR